MGAKVPTDHGRFMKLRVPMVSRDWLFIVPVALLDGLLLCAGTMRLVWRPEIFILLSALGLAVIELVYTRYRHAPRLAKLAQLGYSLILFTNVAAVGNVLADGLAPLPLWDHRLNAADRALGLDWPALYHSFTAHPALYNLSTVIYGTLSAELVCLLILLELSGRHRQALTLRYGFYLCGLITIGLGVLMPAAGPFAFYDLPIAKQTAYVVQFAALRDGTLRTIDLANVQGLISFPSFHATLAVLCAHAARAVRGLLWPAILLNTLIIGTAPVIGGHYFVDIFAGMVLAVSVIAALTARAR
jgi:hypothetical protein